MSQKLPDEIEAFFAAKNRADGAAAAERFSPDGVVHDEGQILRGRSEIARWVRETSEKYADSTAILGFALEGEAILVRRLVSGKFDGSPAALSFRFELGPEGIQSLQIS